MAWEHERDWISDPYAEYYIKSSLRRKKLFGYQISSSDPPRQRSEYPALSVQEFCALLWQCFKVLKPDMWFNPAYPDELLTFPEDAHWDNIWNSDSQADPGKRRNPDPGIITWHVIDSQPASMSGKPFGPVKEIKARIREYGVQSVLAGANDENQVVGDSYTIKGQLRDVLLQFDIWARDLGTVEDLVEFFDDFMNMNEGLFLQHGLSKIYWSRQLEDDKIWEAKMRGKLPSRVPVRSLQYMVRTEKITLINAPLIEQIDIEIQKNSAAFGQLEEEWKSNK